MPEHAPHAPLQVRHLRRRIGDLSLRLRTAGTQMKPAEPRFVDYDKIRLPGGELVGRKKVIVMSGGCSVPTCTMCPFTNFNNYGLDGGSSSENLLDQVRRTLTRTEGEPAYEVLSLYNDGSFFAPREIPREVQVEIACLVAAAGVKRLVVESLPQFVTEPVLAPFVEALGGVRLEIGIGLQSADELVRETLVNTRISHRSFERALSVMAGLGVDPKIYLLIKPPFLSEGEAVTDVVQSVDYLTGLGVRGMTLCPTRVSRHTVAWELWQAGQYTPPNLWTVVEAVRRVHERLAVRVACVNLRGTDFESVFPDACPACADTVVDALMRFGESGDPGDLPAGCSCRPPLKVTALDHAAITARAAQQLNVLERAGV
uniref:Radical SAM domain protein n=1 Tax=Streptomyces sp. FR1 TaxID=349971 RepID=V9Z3U9_9ACTN|nr:radical SAM protein [Streptomyces sp. FR1]AHE39207.1 Radical SAM domain protein [Streptomyces sp. FR1]